MKSSRPPWSCFVSFIKKLLVLVLEVSILVEPIAKSGFGERVVTAFGLRREAGKAALERGDGGASAASIPAVGLEDVVDERRAEPLRVSALLLCRLVGRGNGGSGGGSNGRFAGAAWAFLVGEAHSSLGGCCSCCRLRLLPLRSLLFGREGDEEGLK